MAHAALMFHKRIVMGHANTTTEGLFYKQIGSHSYNQLFQTAQALKLGQGALAQILRRMVFNVLAVNNDDHTKNFSFLLREGGRWELAPAYDITHAYRPDSEWVREHQMSVNGRFDGITRADVRVVAERFGLLAELPKALDAVTGAVRRWGEFAREAGVAAEEIATIAGHMAERERMFGG